MIFFNKKNDMMTYELYEEIKANEAIAHALRTVYKMQYKRGTTHAQDLQVATWIGEVEGKEPPVVGGCGNCIYNLYLRLAKTYFKFEEEITSKKITQKDDKERAVQEISRGTKGTKKTKKGRRKKTDKGGS